MNEEQRDEVIATLVTIVALQNQALKLVEARVEMLEKAAGTSDELVYYDVPTGEFKSFDPPRFK